MQRKNISKYDDIRFHTLTNYIHNKQREEIKASDAETPKRPNIFTQIKAFFAPKQKEDTR